MPNPDELMKRYENRMAEEEAEAENLVADIPLAKQRASEAQARANAVYDAARELVAKGMLQAAGYRVMVKPIEAIIEMEAAEQEVAPTLAEAGFEVKSLAQKEREDRGENHGIVMHIGPVAFQRHGGRGAWCEEGQTIVFNRYAGTRVEHPPGSRVFYQLINDEDVYGVIV